MPLWYFQKKNCEGNNLLTPDLRPEETDNFKYSVQDAEAKCRESWPYDKPFYADLELQSGSCCPVNEGFTVKEEAGGTVCEECGGGMLKPDGSKCQYCNSNQSENMEDFCYDEAIQTFMD